MSHSPSIVPEDGDRDVYIVLDNFGGRLGRAWCETDEERIDRETVTADLFSGQYRNWLAPFSLLDKGQPQGLN